MPQGVFVDGVDGAGKTTLIRELVAILPAGTAHVAAPLWHYLPVPTPAEFGPWITTTPAAEVAAALLTSAAQRLTDVQAQRATMAAGAVLFVDRGPRTIVASALAHLHTGTAHADGTDLAAAIDHLRRLVTLRAGWIAVELRVPDYARIKHRLDVNDQTDQRYQRYLTGFLRYLLEAPVWPGTRPLILDATADLAVNVAAVRAAL